ncbi:hypothetical protein DMN91_008951, partial [Ooceraea biroi]
MRSLHNLQLSYLDLYLVHTPFAFEEAGDDLHPRNEKGEIRMDVNTDHLKVWSMMEQQVQEGRTRAIGLSNFNVKFCRDNKISVTAYSPLGTRGYVKQVGMTETIPNMLENPTVLEMAKAYNKTPAQILLKFIVQRGIIAIPKSTNPKRIQENIQLFDWELEVKDMEKLRALDMGESARI